MLQDIKCPKCGKKIAKREQEYLLKGVYLWCPKCKKNIDINKNIIFECSSNQ